MTSARGIATHRPSVIFGSIAACGLINQAIASLTPNGNF
jgi:hypothetical protein